MPDPRDEYGTRLNIHLSRIATKERIHLRFGYAKLAVVVAGLVCVWLCFALRLFSGYWLLAPLGVYVVLTILHEQTIRARTCAETTAVYYRAGLARIDDKWAGTGASGERFRSEKHVYADDLDIFGRGCLFELLSTARLPMGENRLAQWLRTLSPARTIVERQGLVAELRPKLDLREDLAVTGEELRVRLNPESLTEWCEGQPQMGGAASRVVAAAFALLAVAGVAYWFTTLALWPLFLVLIFEAIISIWLYRRAVAVVSGVTSNAEGIALFARIMQRLEAESFASPRLNELRAQLTQGTEPASRAILRLARIVNWIEGRDNLIAKLIDLPLLYTIQAALAADAWRRLHGRQMRAWIEVAGEMEALLSLATYSFEHPADPFPEFTDPGCSAPLFDAEEIGHPLIPRAECVRNSVRLGADTRVLMVSGSNMSGKSTLLRAVGINAVLAMAGAPIRGKSLRLTPLALGTRLRSTDSLQEHRSTFFTELLRIREVFELTKGETPVLFLFDELLDGTNSHDRRIGAESLVRALLERGAIGMVSTHDLALTELAAQLGTAVRNAHLQDYVEDGAMRFDYKLREGVVIKSNALELMRLVGLNV